MIADVLPCGSLRTRRGTEIQESVLGDAAGKVVVSVAILHFLRYDVLYSLVRFVGGGVDEEGGVPP